MSAEHNSCLASAGHTAVQCVLEGWDEFLLGMRFNNIPHCSLLARLLLRHHKNGLHSEIFSPARARSNCRLFAGRSTRRFAVRTFGGRAGTRLEGDLRVKPEEACLILRNSPEVVRKHYIRLLQEDTKADVRAAASSKPTTLVQQLCSRNSTKPA